MPTPTVENNVSVRFFFDRRIENLNMKNLDEETLDKIIANGKDTCIFMKYIYSNLILHPNMSTLQI